MIIGISGFASTGKDTTADFMVATHGFAKVALADPLKRIAKDVYDFTDEQLWGPSAERNKLDKRYPREHTFPDDHHDTCVCCGWGGTVEAHEDGPPQCYLTTRYALMLLGSEWGRHCYDPTWVEYTIRVAGKLLETKPPHNNPARPNWVYSYKWGLRGAVDSDMLAKGVVISDVRFKNEVAGIKKAGGKLIRIKRTGYEEPAFNHPSETEQMDIPDSDFDYILENYGTLDLLGKLTARGLDVLQGRLLAYDEENADVPPFKR